MESANDVRQIRHALSRDTGTSDTLANMIQACVGIIMQADIVKDVLDDMNMLNGDADSSGEDERGEDELEANVIKSEEGGLDVKRNEDEGERAIPRFSDSEEEIEEGKSELRELEGGDKFLWNAARAMIGKKFEISAELLGQFIKEYEPEYLYVNLLDKSLDGGYVESLVSKCFEVLILSNPKWSKFNKSQASTKNKHLGTPRSLLFDFLKTIGHSTLTINKAKGQMLSVNVQFDLKSRLRVGFFGTLDELQKLTYEDLRNKVKEEIPQSFIFVGAKNEHEKILKDGVLKSINVEIAKFKPEIEDFVSFYKMMRIEDMLLTRFIIDGASVAFATLKTFGVAINIKSFSDFFPKLISDPLLVDVKDWLNILITPEDCKSNRLDLDQIDFEPVLKSAIQEAVHSDYGAKDIIMTDYHEVLKNLTDFPKFDLTSAEPKIFVIREIFSVSPQTSTKSSTDLSFLLPDTLQILGSGKAHRYFASSKRILPSRHLLKSSTTAPENPKIDKLDILFTQYHELLQSIPTDD